MSNVIIRKASIKDLEAVVDIEAVCFPETEMASKSSLSDRLNHPSSYFLVAELNNKLIGFINGAPTNNLTINDELFSDSSLFTDNGFNIAIFGLDVLPSFRRNGIAALLMNKFIDLAKVNNRQRVILTCKEHLISYYEKFGFNNDGVSNSIHGGAVWYDMTLTL